jgi:molybdate transport system substrate-binding protein
MFLLPLVVCADVTVFSAASATDVMQELATQFTRTAGHKVHLNLGSSGTLARQLEAGAPADLYISASPIWVDYLSTNAVVNPTSRMVVASNVLVAIVPAGGTLSFEQLGRPGTSRIAVGDMASVPAGMYAKEALSSLEWFDVVRPRLVQCPDVRAVLTYVSRGEVDAGIVYASDARGAKMVQQIGVFDAALHAPVLLCACRTWSRSSEADAFLAFLTSEGAAAVWQKHGFGPPPKKEVP